MEQEFFNMYVMHVQKLHGELAKAAHHYETCDEHGNPDLARLYQGKAKGVELCLEALTTCEADHLELAAERRKAAQAKDDRKTKKGDAKGCGFLVNLQK